MASSSSSAPGCWRRRVASRRRAPRPRQVGADELLGLLDQAVEAELPARPRAGLDGAVGVEEHPVAGLERAVPDLGDGDPEPSGKAGFA